MSLVYSGGPYLNTTFIGDTIANLKTAINNQLVVAGWTSTVTGGGFRLDSVSSPQALQCRVYLLDNGSSVTVQFKSVDETKVGFLHTVPPAANRTFRIQGSKYWFAVAQPNVSAAASGIVVGGVPFVPSFLTGVTSTAIFSCGDSGSVGGFRTNIQTSSGSTSYIFNSFVASGSGQGNVQIVPVRSTDINLSSGSGVFWFNGCALIAEPLIAWGTASSAVPKVIGQLWDASLVMQNLGLDYTATFDGHNWMNFTDNSTTGSLLFVTS